MARSLSTVILTMWISLVVAREIVRREVIHEDEGAGNGDAFSLIARRTVMKKEANPERKVVKQHAQDGAASSHQTTWHCKGKDSGHRHCTFKNLYYGVGSAGGKGDFLMFVTEDQDVHDVQLLRADKYEGAYQPQVSRFPNVEKIKQKIDSKVLLEEPGLSVQFNPLFHQNIGHAIFDGLYPAYNALIALGQGDRKFRPVVAVGPDCFDEHGSSALEAGVLVETYLPDSVHGRSLRTEHATIKSTGSLVQRQERSCKFQRGLDSSGAELGSQGAMSENHCCKACSNMFGCESVVFFAGICYFKGKCPDGSHTCSYARDNERLLCTLEGSAQESNITVLQAGSTSEVSVPMSWVIGRVKRRCMSEGVFETFGRSGEMRRLFEMERDVAANPKLLVRFEEIILGVGGAGNMVSDKSGAIGGSQPPKEAMSRFRDRMYAAYGIPVNHDKPKAGDKLNVMVVSNKRFHGKDSHEIKKALEDIHEQGAIFGEILDWGQLGQPDTRFRDHLKRVSEADVYVSSIGTALQYVPFMRDGRVYVALGSVWQRSQRLFPTFMEQQLAGAGTPYLRTLYADPGSMLREQKPSAPGAMLLDLGEDGYTANVNGTLLAELLTQAQTLVRGGFNMPVPVEENLSKEGRLMVELCKKDPQTCQRMQADRNGANFQCAALLWNECVVYEVGPWAEGGGCTVNRKLLRQLRREHRLFSYGAPELE